MIHKGTLTIEYECESADMSDPMSTDYLEIVKITNTSGEEIKLRPEDDRMLRNALVKIWNHAVVDP